MDQQQGMAVLLPFDVLKSQAEAHESIYRRAAAQAAKEDRAVRPTYNEVPAEFYHLPRVPKVPFFTPAALAVGMARLK